MIDLLSFDFSYLLLNFILLSVCRSSRTHVLTGVAIGGHAKLLGDDNLGELRMAYLAYCIFPKRRVAKIRKISHLFFMPCWLSNPRNSVKAYGETDRRSSSRLDRQTVEALQASVVREQWPLMTAMYDIACLPTLLTVVIELHHIVQYSFNDHHHQQRQSLNGIAQ